MKKLTKFIIIISLSLCIFSAFAPITAYAYDDYYIVNATSVKFHRTTCSYLPDYGNRYPVPRDKIGDYPKLSPCKHCDPLNNLVYEPENPGQSSSGNSSSGSSKQKTWIERKEKEGTPLLDFLTVLFLGAITLLSIALFVEVYPDNNYYRLSWLGKISLFFLSATSIMIIWGILNVEGSGIIKLFVNASLLLIIFAISLLSSGIWCLINKDKISI